MTDPEIQDDQRGDSTIPQHPAPAPGYQPPQYQAPAPGYRPPYATPLNNQQPYPVAPYRLQYGSPGYAPPPPRGLSISSMVIGIVSVVFSWVSFFLPVIGSVVPVVGLVLGIIGLKREPAARGFALTGIWINAVLVALTLLLLIGFIVLVALGLAVLPLFASTSEPNV